MTHEQWTVATIVLAFAVQGAILYVGITANWRAKGQRT